MFEYREVLDAFTKRSVDILQENLVEFICTVLLPWDALIREVVI